MARENRIATAMQDEGLSYLQAVRVTKDRDYVHQKFRRSPRDFDFRWGKEL